MRGDCSGACRVGKARRAQRTRVGWGSHRNGGNFGGGLRAFGANPPYALMLGVTRLPLKGLSLLRMREVRVGYDAPKVSNADRIECFRVPRDHYASVT
jgi:hypothetical protein